MADFVICIYPNNFTYDGTNYTTDRFNTTPIDYTGDLYLPSSPPIHYVWNRNVSINYGPNVQAPIYRFRNIENNSYFIEIIIEANVGYRFKPFTNVQYGVTVGTPSNYISFAGTKKFPGNISTSWYSFNNDYTRLTLLFADIRTIPYCDNSGYPANELGSGDILSLLLYGIDFEEIPIGTYYTITQNLSGCVTDYSKSSELENTEITINLTPNTNHRFLTVPSYTMGGITANFTQTQTGYTATFILTNDVTINASATECYPITQTITNATSNYTNDYIIKGETITITLTPNAGYYFPQNSCTYIDENGTTSPMTISANGIATCTFYVNDLYQYGGQRINGDAIRTPSEKYAFIGIYNPTLAQLVTLSQQRFVNVQGLVDLTGYVISLKKYYCDIDTDGRESVYYGTHNTQVQCDTVDTAPFDLDCGEIEIVELYNNSLDYDNTTIILYLPFIGEITLDTKRVMGKTVSLIYRVNPVNGDCIAILSDSISDISIEQGNLAFQIPIKEHETSVYVNNYEESPLFMASLTPQIRIHTDEIYGTTPLHGYENNTWVLISTCEGYVAFSDIELNPINKINKEEYDEILTLLKSGVIV